MTTITFSKAHNKSTLSKYLPGTAFWRWFMPLMLATFLLGGMQSNAQAANSLNSTFGTSGDTVTEIDALTISTGTSGFSGLFKNLTTLIKDVAKFVTGPVGMLMMLLSIVTMVVLWMMDPKGKIMGPLARVGAGGLAIVNAGAIVAGFSGFV